MKKVRIILILFIVLLSGVSIYAIASGTDQPKDEVRTPDYYDTHVRAAFKNARWEEGKRLLDEGLKTYPTATELLELAGQYHYHHKQYDDARYYLIRSIDENNENVEAKQLLVNVEEETQNYSDAICYVNELLEVNPYWKGLWRRKIRLYRKQNNDVEADRLLKRICQIYPDDEQLKNDYADRMASRYAENKSKGNKQEQLKNLQELVTIYPKSEEYHLALSNLLLQEGRIEDAAEAAERGVQEIPGSVALIKKRAGILADSYRYPEALAYVKQCMQANHSAALSTFYNGLLADAARAESQRDPYVLYGKVYESQHSQEALDYLLSTSLSRGYDDDALNYINEARKRQGDTPDLIYKSYVVNKRMGNVRAANSLLRRLYAINPNDEDIADELARVRLQQASELMQDGAYVEALAHLRFATSCAKSPEIIETAWIKKLACNENMKRYTQAELILDSIQTLFPARTDYIVRKADLKNKQGHTADALTYLENILASNADSIGEEERIGIVAAYEEIALPYIKRLQETGATRRVYDESKRLLAVQPASADALHYAVNASAALHLNDEFAQLVDLGRQQYPDDLFFIVKQSEVAHDRKAYAEALGLLQPYLETYPGDQQLVAANSDNSADFALALVKSHDDDHALTVVDSALTYDGNNKYLSYIKGVVYEAKHEYDSAYVYQARYIPEMGELSEHRRHLNGLIYRSGKNRIDLEYLQGRYGDEDVITAVATAAYTRVFNPRNEATLRLNYAGRDGINGSKLTDEQEPGGQSVQVEGEWTHEFSSKWSGTARLGVGGRYFPVFTANLQATRTFSNGWAGDVHAGYRLINSYEKAFRYTYNDAATGKTYYDEAAAAFTSEGAGWVFDKWRRQRSSLINAGVGATWSPDPFVVSGKADAYLLKSNIYFNVMLQGKYFPLNDGRTNINVLGSVGTAPETTLIDQALPGTFNKLNSMVGLGAEYLLTRHISIGVQGTWHTFYNQTNSRTGTYSNYKDAVTTRYKNLFNIDAQVHISF